MYAQLAWQAERLHKQESFILTECCVDPNPSHFASAIIEGEQLILDSDGVLALMNIGVTLSL